MDTTVKNIMIFMAVVLLFFLLELLGSLLLPLVLALLFAILVLPLVVFLRSKKFPSWLILPVISIFSLLLIFGLFNILVSTTSEIISQQDYLLTRLAIRLQDVLSAIGSLTGQKYSYSDIDTEIQKLYHSGWVTSAVSSVASGVSSFTGSLVMFALYYIFLLSGLSDYKKYIKYVAGDRNTNLIHDIQKIQISINKYMITKTLINLMAGAIIFVVCLIFGIKFALFWGLLTFILNFIPNFGSIFSIAMPMLMGFIQLDSYNLILILLVVLTIIQFSIGNFIEPKIIGNSLRLNTVTVLFGLVFWGYIWGVAGMMLSVPLMVIIKLTLEHSASLSILARIMGYPED